ESAYRAQVAIDSGEAVIVGVNRFAGNSGDEVARPIFHMDPEVERRQIERVRALRGSRSSADWQASVHAVTSAARDGGNLVPPIIAAVEAKATLGEIADAMRSVFGEYSEKATL